MSVHNQKRYVLSIDSSSSSVEANLIDASSGDIEFSFSEPITLFNPREEWFEHDAEEIWEKQLRVLEKALEAAKNAEILGIGIANQRETIVAWNIKTKKPICRSISWQDSRTKEFINRFKDKEPLIRRKTGLYLNEYFSASKIAWILENEDIDEIEDIKFGTIDSWLVYKLTDGIIHFTDVTNASRTMCMNLGTEEWDKELLDLFSIPIDSLPVIRPSGSCFGFWRDIPILGVIGDQQASLLTMGDVEGALHCTYGTGLFVLKNTSFIKYLKEGTVTTIAWKIEGRPTHYALENGAISCGKVLERLKNENYFYSYETDKNQIPLSLYIEPLESRIFLFQKTPVRDISVNFNLDKSRGSKVLKSCLNGLAFIAKELISSFNNTGVPVSWIQLGGQISNIDYLKQVQAIVLEKKVTNAFNGMNSALGAALLVLLTKKLIGWNTIVEFNKLKRREFKYSPIYSLDYVGLTNLWTRVKYSL